MNDKEIVSAVRSWLAETLGQDRCELWFGATTRLSLAAGTLVVETATTFAQDFLRTHYRGHLEKACHAAVGDAVPVQFRVDESLAACASAPNAKRELRRPAEGPALVADAVILANGAAQSLLVRPKSGGVHRPIGPRGRHGAAADDAPRRRFSTLKDFVIGAGNQMAHGLAQMVIQQPGCLTPLVLHGPTGCGKTHLLEGMWSAVRGAKRGANAVFLSAEQFTTYFLEALHGSGLPNFRRKYRGVDVLLIDDLQFLVGKKATLVELLHTIDALLREGRQLIFAADRPPTELSELGPQLTTRLAGGMVCGIEPPDADCRLGLVHQFAQRLDFSLDDDVARHLAEHITAGARELCGVVNRLHATGRLLDRPLNRALAEDAIAETLRSAARAPRLADIARAVSDVFGLSPDSLQSSRRAKTVCTPRMLAMWLARKHTRAGLSEIGQYFGRRSHSTVISAHKRVTDWMARQSDVELADSRCKVDEALRRVEAQLRVG